MSSRFWRRIAHLMFPIYRFHCFWGIIAFVQRRFISAVYREDMRRQWEDAWRQRNSAYRWWDRPA